MTCLYSTHTQGCIVCTRRAVQCAHAGLYSVHTQGCTVRTVTQGCRPHPSHFFEQHISEDWECTSLVAPSLSTTTLFQPKHSKHFRSSSAGAEREGQQELLPFCSSTSWPAAHEKTPHLSTAKKVTRCGGQHRCSETKAVRHRDLYCYQVSGTEQRSDLSSSAHLRQRSITATRVAEHQLPVPSNSLALHPRLLIIHVDRCYFRVK